MIETPSDIRGDISRLDSTISVVEMTRSASVSHLAREFDDFLFASIGEERNGMVLSVVSALARLDLDPWQEAAKLSGMPLKTATQRLATLVAAIPDRPWAPLDAGALAARLIALLPRPAPDNVASRTAGLPGMTTRFSAVGYLISYAILFALMLSAQSIMAGSQPPSRPDSVQATSGSVIPQMPAPPSDK